MATASRMSDHSILGIGESGSTGVKFLVAGSGSPEAVFERAIGESLRGQTTLLPDPCKAWIDKALADGKELNFIGLQTDVPESDLEFFLDHWHRQFSDLIFYPGNIEKPDVTSNAGLKAETRLRQT